MDLFAKRLPERVSSIGEGELIRRIKGWLGPVSPASPYGIGDDCAVIPPLSTAQVVTVDPVIYRRHFDDSVSPDAVGGKLLKRNVSDIAAMGAQPTHAVISLAMDGRTRVEWLKRFYSGMRGEAQRYGVSIVGGDIAELPGAFVATLTLMGKAVGKRLLTRDGARIGDSIWVTGKLGGSILRHHFEFSPRVEEGQWLARRSETRSMVDVSDGLAKDLPSLLPKKTKPALFAPMIPVSDAAKKLSLKTRRPALEHALCDGEDYELLFTVRAGANIQRFVTAWAQRFTTPLTQIGHVVPASFNLAPEYVALEALRAYEHLR